MKLTARRTLKNLGCESCIFALLGGCDDCPSNRKTKISNEAKPEDLSIMLRALNLKSSSVDLSKTFDGTTYPKTPEEFIAQGWLHRVYRRLVRYTLKDICNEAEDIAIDVFINIIRPSEKLGGSSYLERYDPKSRPFGVYLFRAVNNEVYRRFRRENTDTGRKLANKFSFDTSPHIGGDFAPHTFYDEYIVDQNAEDGSETAQAIDALDTLIDELHWMQEPPFSYSVLDLLLKGYTPNQAASHMKKPRREVMAVVERIRGSETVKTLMVECGWASPLEVDTLN